MAYITGLELKDYLDITGTAHDSVLQQMVDSASERIDRFTGRVFGKIGSGFLTHSNLGETHFVDRSEIQLLDEWPVQSISSIKIDGDSLTEGTDFVVDKNLGILTFLSTAQGIKTPHRFLGWLEVDYIAGFEVVPQEVPLTAFRLGSYWFSRKGAEGLGAQLIGDLQETFRSPEETRILEESVGHLALNRV